MNERRDKDSIACGDSYAHACRGVVVTEVQTEPVHVCPVSGAEVKLVKFKRDTAMTYEEAVAAYDKAKHRERERGVSEERSLTGFYTWTDDEGIEAVALVKSLEVSVMPGTYSYICGLYAIRCPAASGGSWFEDEIRDNQTVIAWDSRVRLAADSDRLRTLWTQHYQTEHIPVGPDEYDYECFNRYGNLCILSGEMIDLLHPVHLRQYVNTCDKVITTMDRDLGYYNWDCWGLLQVTCDSGEKYVGLGGNLHDREIADLISCLQEKAREEGVLDVLSLRRAE